MAKYFNDHEVDGLDQKLIDMLDRMRDSAGIPIVITCGERTPEHNAELATSVSDSAHLKGLAADLHCADSKTRYKLIKAALAVEFRRIEIGTAHIHVDIDPDKPQEVMWLGISS